MIQPIFIDKRPPKQSLFMVTPTEKNLVEDIKIFCMEDVCIYVDNLTIQKEKVINISYSIHHILDILKSKALNYEIVRILDTVKWFILITDKSIYSFTIEIQLMVNNNLTKFSITGI